MTNINYEMEDVANDYLNLLNDENTELLTARARQDSETQIFWESENLQFERQKQMGIRETFDLAQARPTKSQAKAGIQVPEGRVAYEREGNVCTGKSHRVVNVTRKIWKGSDLLKEFKSADTDCTVSVLKADVNEENQVACPNCGAYGAIESFIDGCDFCGSQFEVKDFKAKVSGFSLIESIDKVVKKIVSRMTKAYIIMFAAVWSLGFLVPLFITLFWAIQGGGTVLNGGTVYVDADNLSVMDWLIGLSWTKVGSTMVKSFLILFASVVALIIISNVQAAFAHTEKITGIYPNFSETEFRAEVEHHLKTAMMAGNPLQAMAYSDVDMTAFLEAHRDVFDMNIAKMEFLSAEPDYQNGGYRIDTNVTVKLYRYKIAKNGKEKVTEEYEKINLTLSLSDDAGRKKMTAIREYECPGCGSAMNIYRGNICPYCGRTFDKRLAGPVIEYCTWTKQANYYRTVPKIVLIAAIVILVL